MLHLARHQVEPFYVPVLVDLCFDVEESVVMRCTH